MSIYLFVSPHSSALQNSHNLVSFCTNGSTDIHSGADDSREKILDSNIVDDLLARLESFDTDHWHVRQSVVLFIAKLVEHGKFRLNTPNTGIYSEAEVARLKILDSDIVEALLTTLGDNDPNVRRSALECTEKLLQYGKFQVNDRFRYSRGNR